MFKNMLSHYCREHRIVNDPSISLQGEELCKNELEKSPKMVSLSGSQH